MMLLLLRRPLFSCQSAEVQRCCQRVISRSCQVAGQSSLRVSPCIAAAVGLSGSAGRARWHSSSIVDSRRGTPTRPAPNTLMPPSESARWFSLSRWRSSQKSGPQQQQQPARKESRLRKVLPASLTTPHENIYTIPNLLTISRLVAAPFVGYCILHGYHGWALGLFAYASVSDMLDGWIARKWNLGTVVGTIIDPLADKSLMTVLTVTLAMQGSLPVWLAVIILGRDVGLGISAIYYRWISLPPPKTFSRYWDFSLPSAEVRPTTISKYNTALQLGLMGLTTLAPVVPLDLATSLTVMQYVVATTTILSGASYVFSKDAVKILSQPKEGSDGDKPQ